MKDLMSFITILKNDRPAKSVLAIFYFLLSTCVVFVPDVLTEVELSKFFAMAFLTVLFLIGVASIFFFDRTPINLDLNITDIIVGIYILYLIMLKSIGGRFGDDISWMWIFMWLNYYLIRFFAPEDKENRSLMVTAVTLAIASLVALSMIFNIFFPESRDFLVTNPFFNNGPAAQYLAYMSCLAFHYLIYKSEVPSYMTYLSLMVLSMAFILFAGNDSRTSLLCLFVGLAYIWSIRKSYLSRKGIVASMVVVFLVFSGFLAFFFKSDSAAGRILIWKISLNNLSSDFWIGKGLNIFQDEYPKWQESYFSEGGKKSEILLADKVAYAYNDFLQIFIEQGSVGLLFFTAIIFTVFFLISLEKKDSLWKALLLCIVCSMAFSYPLEMVVHSYLLVVSVALLSSFQQKKTINIYLSKWKVIVLSVTVFFASVTSSYLLFGKYVLRRHQVAADVRYRTGDLPGAEKSYFLLFHELDHDASFLQNYGKTLSRLGKYQLSDTVLNKAEQLTSDPFLFITMAENRMKSFEPRVDEAANLLRRAIDCIPNRMYPRYLLFKLFVNHGRIEEAKNIANEILSMDIKVASQATATMQNDVKTKLRSLENAR
ncbi:O-antigen ligase family protein [Olivibacter sp. CPCC 100613]|uniref:O-antigen ligase family protein n=1 Tax=Olivibacter sp. CPCC 100613 TaxID=3079931 RepID=UPI002FFA9317